MACLSHSDESARPTRTHASTHADAVEHEPSSVQLGHLRRLCRTVEARLGDAELTLDAVAAIEGLSTSYVQKLFRVASAAFCRLPEGASARTLPSRSGQPRAGALHDRRTVLSLGLRRRRQLQPRVRRALRRVAQGLPRRAAAGRAPAPRSVARRRAAPRPARLPSAGDARTRPSDARRRQFEAVLNDHAALRAGAGPRAQARGAARRRADGAARRRERAARRGRRPPGPQLLLPAGVRQDRALGLPEPHD